MTPSLYTAPTVRESLDETPEAARLDWTVSPAHLLGDASPSVLVAAPPPSLELTRSVFGHNPLL